MDGQYLPDDEIDIDSLASSEPPEYVPQMFSEGGEVEPPVTEESTALRNIRQRIVELEKQKLALWAEKNQPEMLTANNNELAGVLIRMRGEDLRDRDNSSRPLNDYYQTLPTEENIFELRRQMPRPESFNYPPLIEEGRDTRELEKKFQDDIFEGERDWEKQLDLPYSGPYHRGGPYSQGGEVKERDIEYYTKGGEASLDSQTEAMNKYLLGEEEDAMPMAYATEPTRPTQTAKAMLKKVTMKSGGGSKRPKEMSLEEGDLSPAIPELGAPQTEQDKLVQIATARAQYDALERAYQLKAQAAQKAGRGLMRPTFNALAFDKPTLEKRGPLMARTFSKGGEADKKDPELTGINRVSDFIAQRLPASVFPTSGRTFLETVQGKRDPITEGNFSPEELAVMKEMIALKGGDAGDIQYSDYHALAKVMRAQGKIPASTNPSLFSMSDSLGNVQTTLGRFKYGRDAEGNLVVRDTYDFNPPRVPNSMQEQRTAEYGAMGPYRLVREYAGEKIPPGRGREININLGKPVKGAEGSPAAKIFQSARDEYNRQEKELLRLDKPTLEKMARPLARTFAKGGEADALEGMQKKARENEMYRASEKYLQSRGQIPDIELERMGLKDSAVFSSLNLPIGSGTITINKDDIDRNSNSNIGPALLAHEITHAADRQMKQQAIEQRGKGTKFAEAYEKLMGSEGRNRLEPARRADYEWTEGHRFYRSTPGEIAAFGVGAFSEPMPKHMMPDRAPLHVDPTAATEFQILLDLAQRDIDKGPKGLERVPTFLRKFFKYADGGPVYRAEGSPASGERLTPQQIEQLAADQAALNQYYAAKARPSTGMNRKRGPISQQLDSGEAYANMAKGVTEFPYDLLGAPRDISNMIMTPFGYGVKNPVMGSDWIKQQMTKRGIRPEPPADPTSKGFYTAGELLSNLTNPAGVARKVGPVVEKGVAAVGKEAARQVERGMFNEGPLRAITPQPMYISRPPGGYFPTSRGMGEKTAEEINNTKLSELPEDFVSWLSKDDKQKGSFLGLGPKRESLGDKYNRWKAETGSKDYTFGILSGVDKSLQPVLKKITEMESGEKRDALFQMFNQKAKDFYSKQAGSVQDPLRADILSGRFKFDEKSQMGDVFPQVLVKQAAQGNSQALRLLEKSYDDMIDIRATVPYRQGQPVPAASTLKSQIIESVRDNLDSIPDSQLLAYAGKKPLPGPDGVAKAAKEIRLKLKENPSLFSTVLEPNIERTVFARQSTTSDLNLAQYPNSGPASTKAMVNPQGPALTKEQLDKMETLPRGYYLPEMEAAIDKSQPILDANQYGNLKLLGLSTDKLLQEASKLSVKDLNSMGFTDFLKKAYTSTQEVAQIEKDLEKVKSLLQQGKNPPSKAMLFGVKDFLPTVNDMRWVKVTDPDGVKSIAAGMNNSVGSYATSNTYGKLGRGRRALDSGEIEVYSLYDKNHIPQVTVEYATNKASVPEEFRGKIVQLTGNGPLTANAAPEKFSEELVDFVNKLKLSPNQMPIGISKILEKNFFKFDEGKFVRNEEEFSKFNETKKELGLAKGGSVDKNMAFIKKHT
jgi:hypothetical protein